MLATNLGQCRHVEAGLKETGQSSDHAFEVEDNGPFDSRIYDTFLCSNPFLN